ncbi:MAG: hypothetical protein OEW69_06490, partial [Nitrospirota bacterium]|nr:hypothetical protein [Nitrospirota bacterium]
IAESNKLLNKINRTPLFWQRVLHSLQVNFLITLSRIFDTHKDDPFTVSYLIKYCVNNKNIFSKDQLEKRKSKALHPELLEKYMRCIPTEPVTSEDFTVLTKQIDTCKEMFNKNYTKIRNKLLAHKDKKYIDKEDALFSKTSIGELENMLDFLNRISTAIWELYANGRNLDVNKVESSDYFKKMAIQDTKDILNKVLS